MPLTLGVISDTHVPDRVRQLDPQAFQILQTAGVQAILHAGDVSGPQLLAQLEQIAPVYAVKGNRDFLWLPHLPAELRLEFGGVMVGMAHGHGGWKHYLLDRPYFMVHGYHYERLLPRLKKAFPQQRVIIFGHGHAALNQWIDGQLFFNPGSPHLPDNKDLARSIGLLHISAEGEVQGEIIELGQATASGTSL